MQSTIATIAVPLPGTFVWHVRSSPRPRQFAAWRHELTTKGATVRSWALLMAAYDAGWDVIDEVGAPVPPPFRLSLRGYNRVPAATLLGLVEWLRDQAAQALKELPTADGVVDGTHSAISAPSSPVDEARTAADSLVGSSADRPTARDDAGETNASAWPDGWPSREQLEAWRNG